MLDFGRIELLKNSVVFICCIMLAGCTNKIPDLHKHAVAMPKFGSLTAYKQFKITRINPEEFKQIENLTRTADNTYEAFSTTGNPCRIIVRDLKTNTIYEIMGLPLPYRPFSSLAWFGARYLEFDRWSQPHFGIHYVADIKLQKIVMMAQFPDEFYLHPQKEE
jgi:hypothetical protein